MVEAFLCVLLLSQRLKRRRHLQKVRDELNRLDCILFEPSYDLGQVAGEPLETIVVWRNWEVLQVLSQFPRALKELHGSIQVASVFDVN